MIDEHIREKRLLEIADEQTRLAAAESGHLETCTECLTAFAKSILHVARARAKEKCRPAIASPREPFH